MKTGKRTDGASQRKELSVHVFPKFLNSLNDSGRLPEKTGVRFPRWISALQ